MAAASPTSRSLSLLRAEGHEAEVVEKWVPHIRVRRDFLGIIDIIAVAPGRVLGVQTTSRPNQAARLAKALAEPRLRAWLLSGALFEIHGWALAGARGARKTWQVTRRPVTLQELELPPNCTTAPPAAAGCEVSG